MVHEITNNKETYTVTLLNKEFIQSNKDRLFTAWVNVWKGSRWSTEEYFLPDESIDYITHLSKTGLTYIIEHDDSIIAFVAASNQHFPKPKNSQENAIQLIAKKLVKKPGYFHELAILESYRGMGIGSQLMDMIEHTIHAHGADGMFLWTRKESRSQNLYLKRGYVRIGEAIVPKNNTVGKEHRVYFLKLL